MSELIKNIPDEKRELVLLRAALQMFKKQDASFYVQNCLELTAVWDGVECDGGCFMEEAENLLLEMGIDPMASND